MTPDSCPRIPLCMHIRNQKTSTESSHNSFPQSRFMDHLYHEQPTINIRSSRVPSGSRPQKHGQTRLNLLVRSCPFFLLVAVRCAARFDPWSDRLRDILCGTVSVRVIHGRPDTYTRELKHDIWLITPLYRSHCLFIQSSCTVHVLRAWLRTLKYTRHTNKLCVLWGPPEDVLWWKRAIEYSITKKRAQEDCQTPLFLCAGGKS